MSSFYKKLKIKVIKTFVKINLTQYRWSDQRYWSDHGYSSDERGWSDQESSISSGTSIAVPFMTRYK